MSKVFRNLQNNPEHHTVLFSARCNLQTMHLFDPFMSEQLNEDESSTALLGS